jgi:hypothetical protein
MLWVLLEEAGEEEEAEEEEEEVVVVVVVLQLGGILWPRMRTTLLQRRRWRLPRVRKGGRITGRRFVVIGCAGCA